MSKIFDRFTRVSKNQSIMQFNINYTLVCTISLIILMFDFTATANVMASSSAETAIKIESGTPFLFSNSFILLLYIITILSVLAAICSSIVAFKFYSWRQKLDLTGAMVPEHWAEYLESVGSNLNKQTEVIERLDHSNKEQINSNQKSQKFIQANTQKVFQESESTKDMLLEFQASLDAKDKEISRLKEGYDIKILRNILIQLITLHAQCLELMNKEKENKLLSNFEVLIRDTIEHSGVEIGAPSIGKAFSDYAEFVEAIGSTTAQNTNLQKGQISQIFSYFYVFKGASSRTVLKKSKIKYHLPEELK